MFNLGDDSELDQASREAAGRYTPPGNPDWQALNAELDKVMPVEKKKRRIFFYWWLLPVLLIGGGAAYWLIHKENFSEVSVVTEPVSTQINKKENKTALPAEPSANTQKENSKPVINQTEKQTAAVQISKQSGKRNIVTPERTEAGGNGSLTVNARKNKTAPAVSPVKEQPMATHAITTSKDQPVKQDEPVTNASPKTGSDAVKETAKGNTDLTAETPKDNTATVKEDKTEPAKTADATQDPQTNTVVGIPKLSQQRGKGFSFGILAGIDKSTVKFKYANDAGVNIGFIAGYHFSDRWSVHTGAIYTQKNYKLAGSDFTAPKGSWPSFYKLENVEGYCRMWEVPLLARYTISQTNRNSIFLSTGLSSYFMTSEKYDYTYYPNNGPMTTRSMEYNSSDTHIMSILHLSAGFENRISRSLSLQVEPYAKLPLGGVGFGNIRLSSFGLNFSVQYRQPSKK
jgi:hypothetical protein